MAEKTKEIKDITIKGLEPEIQTLVQKHRQEVADLREAHMLDTKRQMDALSEQHNIYVRCDSPEAFTASRIRCMHYRRENELVASVLLCPLRSKLLWCAHNATVHSQNTCLADGLILSAGSYGSDYCMRESLQLRVRGLQHRSGLAKPQSDMKHLLPKLA